MTNEVPSCSDQICFVLVHGAKLFRHLPFGADAVKRRFDTNTWFLKGSPLRDALDERFPHAQVQTFEWTGLNNQECRYEWAVELSAQLKNICNQYGKTFLIGHSHGGIVALMAAQIADLTTVSVITLGTPFIKADFNRSSQRVGMIYILFSFVVMLAGSFVLFYIMPVAALIYILAYGLFFGATLFWWNIHEKIGKGSIAETKSYFQPLVASNRMNILSIYYADADYAFEWKNEFRASRFFSTGKDFILKLSDMIGYLRAKTRQWQNDSSSSMSLRAKWLNLATIGSILFVSVLIIYLLVLFGIGFYLMYVLLAVIILFTLYMAAAAAFTYYHVMRIFLHELLKINLESPISSFSFKERLLIPTTIQDEPIVAGDLVSLSVIRLPLHNGVKDSHSDICHEARAIQEIEHWVKNSH